VVLVVAGGVVTGGVVVAGAGLQATLSTVELMATPPTARPVPLIKSRREMPFFVFFSSSAMNDPPFNIVASYLAGWY